MSALFLELARTVLFLSSRLAPHVKVAKALSVVKLATKNLLVSGNAVVGLALLATTLAAKHLATLLSDCVLVRQRLESLFKDITGVNPLSLICFVPSHRFNPAKT